jgi:hypothetical protein
MEAITQEGTSQFALFVRLKGLIKSRRMRWAGNEKFIQNFGRKTRRERYN